METINSHEIIYKMNKWCLKIYLKIIKAPNVAPCDFGMLVCTNITKQKIPDILFCMKHCTSTISTAHGEI